MNVNQYNALQEDDEDEDDEVDTDESEIELSEDDAEEDSLSESIIKEMVDHEMEENNSEDNSNTDHSTYLTVYTPISILRSPTNRSQRAPKPSRVTFASNLAPTILVAKCRVTKHTTKSCVLVTDSGCTHHMDNTKSNF